MSAPAPAPVAARPAFASATPVIGAAGQVAPICAALAAAGLIAAAWSSTTTPTKAAAPAATRPVPAAKSGDPHRADIKYADGEARLLRFPAIHGDRIVFTHAGDLYTVPATGGVARRLTSHDGFEMFARFSPDGKHVAFTGQYDGNTEVYAIPAEGGVPRRLTHTATLSRDDVSDRMGPNNIVMGWSPDGRRIHFRSRMASYNAFVGRLYSVPVEGGPSEPFPLPAGGFSSWSPDGTRLAYNRIFREFRTWKRYRGGMADELWLWDKAAGKVEPLTDDAASDLFPMWWRDLIVFASDRDEPKRFNLYALDPKTKAVRRLTHFTDFDVKFPSLGGDTVVFENGGDLWRLDLPDGKPVRVPVRIQEDLAGARGGLRDVSKDVRGADLSPDGKRVVLTARGDVFTVPARNGPARNLTASPGTHDRDAVWSPDGKSIAWISDASGEDEIWVAPSDGREPARRLTRDADTYKYEIVWSPDSGKLLWGDKKQRLSVVDVKTGAIRFVAAAEAWEIRRYAWSPDSKWIAYARPEVDGMQRVYLHSLEKNAATPVTDGWHDADNPVFSRDGKYLYFVSARDFNPVWSRTEWNHAYRDMEGVYLVTLAKDTESPFRPRSDETGEPAGKPDSPKRDKDAPVRIDLDGIGERVIKLPVEAGSYGNLVATDAGLLYLRGTSRSPGMVMAAFDIGERKETVLGPAGGFTVSADGKKLLLPREGGHAIIDLPKAGPLPTGANVPMTGVEVMLDRKAEWRQIYNECWRQMRDFFYDPGLHGVDWAGMRKKYEPLLDHVHHRADLTYVIGEMIGELNAGHAYVGGGDMPKPARVPMGLLGAELERDAKTGYTRIKRILKGANWDPALRSPLTEPGVNVAAGEWIVAINGRPANEMADVYEGLINTVGRQVTLSINGEPRRNGARDVVVVPIADESPLHYHDWVQGNIRKVDAASGGKIGYLHVPDMLAPGLNEFVKHYYPQLHKKALVIDMRGNGGGNVSPQIIERLSRQPTMIGAARNAAPRIDPGGTFNGPMICLLNEYSASDGDLFPYRFKQRKLGLLVGRRSWGGVVGIRGTLPLLDGGFLNRPEFSRTDLEGKNWIIEGHGVDPDVVIDNDPLREAAGVDDQLTKAVQLLLEDLKTKERSIPPLAPAPKR